MVLNLLSGICGGKYAVFKTRWEKKLPIHVLNTSKQGKITAILTLHSELMVVKVKEKSTVSKLLDLQILH